MSSCNIRLSCSFGRGARHKNGAGNSSREVLFEQKGSERKGGIDPILSSGRQFRPRGSNRQEGTI